MPIKVRADTTGCDPNDIGYGEIEIGTLPARLGYVAPFSLPSEVVGAQVLVVGYVIGPDSAEAARLGRFVRFRWYAKLTCGVVPAGAPDTAIATRTTTIVFKPSLQARPGGPYSIARARPIKLDGSGSTPAGRIKRYDWTFRQWSGKGCHPRQPLRKTNVTGARPTIVPLCSLIVRLKVTDRHGHTNAAATRLTVERRASPFAQTPVAHREQPLQDPAHQHPLTPDMKPWAARVDGVNVSDCAPRTGGAALRAWRSILCPYVKAGGEREGHGYEIAQVHDPGGPFDRYWYVSTTDLSVRRVALYNPWMRKDGRPLPGLGITWFAFNQSQGYPVAEYWAALRAHEGMGLPAQPFAGHTGAIAFAIKQGDDPRRDVEPLIALSRENLTRFVNGRLDGTETSLFQAAADPLPVIWQGWLTGLSRELYTPRWWRVGG